MEEQVVGIFAATPQDHRDSWIRGYEIGDIARYERELLDWMHGNHEGILQEIRETGKFEDETKQKLTSALDEFANVFQSTASFSSDDEAA